MKETVVTFGCGDSLVGILTDPEAQQKTRNQPAVILLNAGMVHRVGPNRLYVKMARRLAAQGHVVLRFDFSGFGDSLDRQDLRPLEESALSDVAEAMDFLSVARSMNDFILIGLCSGALAAAATACRDTRVAGAVLINARAGSAELRSAMRGHSALRNYWQLARMQPIECLRRITKQATPGRIWNLCHVLGLKGSLRRNRNDTPLHEASAIISRWKSLAEGGVRLLFVYSNWDPGLDHFKIVSERETQSFLDCPNVGFQVVPFTDHTFTHVEKQEVLLQRIEHWMSGEWSSNGERRGPVACEYSI